MDAPKIKYFIRQATENDVEDIFQMIKELAEYENMQDQCKMTLEQLREDGFGANPVFYSHIAEVEADNKVLAVGYALYYYVYSTWKGKNVYLEDLYVKKEYRKQGIGADLMKTVAKVALENGCVQYRFTCLGWNESSLNFYKSLGACDLTESQDWHMMRLEKEEMQNLSSQLK